MERNSKEKAAESYVVIAHDKKTDGHGASVSLETGNIGTTDVTLKFVSQEGYGINYRIKIYII